MGCAHWDNSVTTTKPNEHIYGKVEAKELTPCLMAEA